MFHFTRKRPSCCAPSRSTVHPPPPFARPRLAAVQALAAAETGQAGPAARVYDIPAGPLDAALARLAGESGLLFAAAPELVRGVSTQGVRGARSVRAALDALLAGTGLEAVRDAATGEYRLRVTPREEVTLPTIDVTGESLRETRTEYTGGYTPQATTLATKLPLSLRETPQSVTVVTRQQMDDFGLNTLDEVMQNTSSVSVQRIGLSTYYQSRGFDMQNKYDGMANPSTTGVSASSMSLRTAPFSTTLKSSRARRVC
ncbi:MAG: TonB-dependent receptor plug domain-containing protein [Candidatus Accumulibacter sp.]|nr:TonB-dependent receptor plug domain-containing protein [Accumulibacter sp.]